MEVRPDAYRQVSCPCAIRIKSESASKGFRSSALNRLLLYEWPSKRQEYSLFCSGLISIPLLNYFTTLRLISHVCAITCQVTRRTKKRAVQRWPPLGPYSGISPDAEKCRADRIASRNSFR